MPQQVMALATQPYYLSLNPGTHMVKEKTNSCVLSSAYTAVYKRICTCAHIQAYMCAHTHHFIFKPL